MTKQPKAIDIFKRWLKKNCPKGTMMTAYEGDGIFTVVREKPNFTLTYPTPKKNR